MESRSKKSARNILTGFASKILLMAAAFSTRTIFIRLLGAEYNGVSGLYSNILSILSLSELGLGNALNYSLYKALKSNDQAKIKSLVAYFKKIYLGVAFAVLGIGIVLIPLLPYIVNSTLSQKEIVNYYLLYLINSVASYFVVYKTTVISADQNNYIHNICDAISTLTMYILQIIYLLIRKDFFGYLIIQVICTILKNIVLNYIANQRYPYINDKSIEIVDFDKKQLLSNIKATFLYKIAAVILNNTDNILISIIVGTVYVGYYSNYYMIVSYIATFVGIFITGIIASLGNLNGEENPDASYCMFAILTLVFSFIGAIVACCFLNCMQGFVRLWIGADYVMPMVWVWVIIINNYLNELMSPIWMFRETMGLFKQVQYLMLVTAALNLIFSIILGILWGGPGILIATALAKIVSQYWYEPRLLFRQRFHRPAKMFFYNQAKQVMACAIAMLSSGYICSFVGDSLLGLILKAVISVVIAIMCVFIVNRKSNAWILLNKKYIIPRFKVLNKN